jgi:hypothetical protein
MLLVALSVPNDAASHVHVIALFDVEGCKAFVNGFDRYIQKRNMRSIEDLARVPVEEVFELKNRRIAHRIACQ